MEMCAQRKATGEKLSKHNFLPIAYCNDITGFSGLKWTIHGHYMDNTARFLCYNMFIYPFIVMSAATVVLPTALFFIA